MREGSLVRKGGERRVLGKAGRIEGDLIKKGR
jgi:hypothetical protein